MELNDYFQGIWYRYKLRQLCRSADVYSRMAGNLGLEADRCTQAFREMAVAFTK